MQCLTRASLLIALAACTGALAQSNVEPSDKFAWSEHAGWLNFIHGAPNPGDGVFVTPTFLSGFIWGEHIGWINTGDGSPADFFQYANADGTDFGVNVEPGTGDLFGFAWGEHVGWINFDTRTELGPFGQQARWNSFEGRFYGYAWGEHLGWINLDFTQPDPPDPICDGDANGDGNVDVNDISYVLFRLTTCNTGGMPCPAGCDGDADMNGFVDVNDIPYVIFRLGTCEPSFCN